MIFISLGIKVKGVCLKKEKYDRFLLEEQKEEIKEFFDKDWIKEVVEKEGKTQREVCEEINKGINGITYNLRVGEEAFTSSKKEIENIKEKGSIEIEPGETVLLMTYEKIDMPEDCMAFLSLKTTHASKGLINISGFHVDPNWRGKLGFSLYNSSPRPIVLRYKDPIYHMFIVRLSNRAWKEKRNTKEWEEKRERMSYFDMKELPSKWIESIKGPAISLQALHERLLKVETHTGILISILVGLIVALVGYLLLIYFNVI
ncbi:dCTP deaminase, dUMP-forming [subsurface metagenome]